MTSLCDDSSSLMIGSGLINIYDNVTVCHTVCIAGISSISIAIYLSGKVWFIRTDYQLKKELLGRTTSKLLHCVSYSLSLTLVCEVYGHLGDKPTGRVTTIKFLTKIGPAGPGRAGPSCYRARLLLRLKVYHIYRKEGLGTSKLVRRSNMRYINCHG